MEDNGYSFSSKEGIITIRKRSGIMGPIVLMVVTLFLSIPVFAAGIIYGVLLIGAVIGAITVQKIFFSDRSSLSIDANNKTFTAKVGTYFQEDQPLSMISTIRLSSKFVDEYTTAARNSVEEYQVSISVQLITKEEITFFQLKSDQSEPTNEVNEVYKMLEDAVKEAKEG